MTRAQMIIAGDVRSAARLMRDIDDGLPSAVGTLKELYPSTGKARIIGITGAPGSGKSTICDILISSLRKDGKKVGVVAIDPTSPYSGGAILGDRIRMQDHALDPGVFIRSMATRGNLGGLSASTLDVVRVMDAMGMDFVIVETVGVGQDEIDIARAAHTTVVVLIPGMGDDIQAIKAGLLEVADVFVVNKADREGADKVMRELSVMLEMRGPERGPWVPPIVKMVALRNEGIGDLRAAMLGHAEFCEKSGRSEAMKCDRIAYELSEVLKARIGAAVARKIASHPGGIEGIVASMIKDGIDPYSISDGLLS
ncbi:MAG: methylmalonyl Co-A mutase-associated GTPase MeaB [Myxococcota bacterium]|jgi:LAO/AO transport system kinase